MLTTHNHNRFTVNVTDPELADAVRHQLLVHALLDLPREFRPKTFFGRSLDGIAWRDSASLLADAWECEHLPQTLDAHCEYRWYFLLGDSVVLEANPGSGEGQVLMCRHCFCDGT